MILSLKFKNKPSLSTVTKLFSILLEVTARLKRQEKEMNEMNKIKLSFLVTSCVHKMSVNLI